jgi:NAD(P)H-hydrate epimerase
LRLATSAQSKECDRLAIHEIGIDGKALMENAGRGAAVDLCGRLGPAPCRVLVLCGGGNNGGDGYVIARHLRISGHHVKVLLLSDPGRLSTDCAYNRSIVQRMTALDAAHAPCPLEWDAQYPYMQAMSVPDEQKMEGLEPLFNSADCLIDAMLGTGLKSEVAGIYYTAIGLVNGRKSPGPMVVSADMPSGLDADTGMPHGVALKADVTYTFGIPKAGLFLYPGRDFAGEVISVGIGMPTELVDRTGVPLMELFDRSLAGSILPMRTGNFHKGDAGHLLVLAGSQDKPGAALLACRAAMRAGGGLCTLASPTGVLSGLAASMSEVMGFALEAGPEGYLDISGEKLASLLSGKDALAIGPGIPTGPGTLALLLRILNRFEGTAVMDADGLNAVAGHFDEIKSTGCRKVFTPHPGELSRLLDKAVPEIQSDRIAAARECSKLYSVVTVLKGAGTVISDADGGRVTINPTGNPGMASGGMGDVLTGMIGAFCACGISAYDSARLGAYVHGLSADIKAKKGATASLVASDVIAGFVDAFALLES